MQRITIDGIEFYTRSNPNGYGYEIVSKMPLDENHSRYTVEFHSYYRDLVKVLFDRIKEKGELINFPDTSSEIPPSKILVHHSKHFTGYYQANTLKELDKVFRYILITEYKDYIHMMELKTIKNESGVTSEEEIRSISIDAVRERIKMEWDEYQSNLKKYQKELKDWENLKDVVLGKGGDANLAMETYESDRWEIEEIQIV